MDKEKIRKLLEDVKDEKIEINDALEILKTLPYEDLGFAKIDTHRELRQGFPEVIFSQGKTLEQILKIVERLSIEKKFIMLTRANKEIYEMLKNIREDIKYYELARIILIGKRNKKRSTGTILVISAGTADLPVAEEAIITAEVMGNKVDRLYDVGVAGIHRLFQNTTKLFQANVIIVVAGMEGALASVIGGIVDKPVIAVPTSIGYGASFGGIAALLTMLNSCASGVMVVNIDNGYGAGYSASMINQIGEE